MAIQKVKIHDTTTPTDIIHPETDSTMVLMNSGNTLEQDLASHNGYGVTSGTSTTYTVTLNPAPVSYVDGMTVTILPHADCGATPTLNINGLGALTIVKQDGTAIASGDIKANKPLALVRVGSNFFIRSSGGSNIKSIQHINVLYSDSTSYDIAINSVNINNSIVIATNFVSSSASLSNATVTAKFKNSTTVTIEKYTASSGLNLNVEITVIEFESNIKIQKGNFTLNVSNYNNPISINTVKDLSKTMFLCQVRVNSSGNYYGSGVFTIENHPSALTTSSFKLATAQWPNEAYVEWQVIEFS